MAPAVFYADSPLQRVYSVHPDSDRFGSFVPCLDFIEWLVVIATL